MKLLIVTQAVDLDDPVLGFFHRWVEELSKRFETVHVICLRSGRFSLPPNVFVHSLGKEGGPSRSKYLGRFYRYIREFRGDYDAVFVHMNEEYVLLGGLLWRLWGKRVVMWRNHAKGSFRTLTAVKLAHTVCYTSPSAFVARYKNATRMPIGIDTEFFAPPQSAPAQDSILFLGRLDPVKNVDVFVRALDLLHEKNVAFHADIVGDPTDAKSKYAHDVRNLASALALEGVVTMHPSVTNEKARDEFRSHAIYCNLTPSGSFDKTIGEAMASGAVVVCANAVVKDTIRDLFVADLSPQGAAGALEKALSLSEADRETMRRSSRVYIEREHSLTLLMTKLMDVLRT